MTSFAEIYSRPDVVRQFDFARLEAPEQDLLRSIMRHPGDPALLDLGIGAGRTTRFFGPLSGSYTGIDIARGMIEHCTREFVGQAEDYDWHLAVGDAADLGDWADGSFDFVLFSFNGLDCLSAEARPRCLAEMLRVLRPGGTLLFSSHNLQAIPVAYHADNPDLSLERLAAISERNEPTEQLMRQASVSFWDGVYGNDVTLRHLYVRPAAQVAALRETGFADIEVAIPATGATVPAGNWDHVTEFCLYYRASKPVSPGATGNGSGPM